MSKRKQRNLHTPPPAAAYPAVSVIIPLYNTEKYIGECLDSLFAQTLKNFEVIVVDDCSTDKSVAIVQSYVEKFGGRLTLTSMKKNSGGGGAPRNKGLSFSRGEYCFFMDADDALTKTGLEEMYTLAKDYDADCVYCERYFKSQGSGQYFVNNMQIAKTDIQQGSFVEEPTLETNDLVARIHKATAWGYWVTPWLRLVSRKLLTENEITFPSLIGSNDVGWVFEVLFCAKRFLLVPNPCYIWRVHEESNTFRPRTLDNLIHKWLDKTIRGIKIIDNFMEQMPFFHEHPDCRYAVLAFFADSDFRSIYGALLAAPPNVLYEIIRTKFRRELGENDVLVSILCSLLNTYQRFYLGESENFRKAYAKIQNRVVELEAALKAKE